MASALGLLFVARSSAVGAPGDAGAPRDAVGNQFNADGAEASSEPCSIDLSGTVMTATRACRVEQPYEPHAADAGGLLLTISSTAPTRRRPPTIVVTIQFVTSPSIAAQTGLSHFAVATVKDGSDVWQARLLPGDSLGALDAKFTSVRPVRMPGRVGYSYEVHGTVSARLLPTVEGTAAGVIDLDVTF